MHGKNEGGEFNDFVEIYTFKFNDFVLIYHYKINDFGVL